MNNSKKTFAHDADHIRETDAWFEKKYMEQVMMRLIRVNRLPRTRVI